MRETWIKCNYFKHVVLVRIIVISDMVCPDRHKHFRTACQDTFFHVYYACLPLPIYSYSLSRGMVAYFPSKLGFIFARFFSSSAWSTVCKLSKFQFSFWTDPSACLSQQHKYQFGYKIRHTCYSSNEIQNTKPRMLQFKDKTKHE